MSINYQKRLELAGKVASFFYKNRDLVDPTDCRWLVGMICDTNLSDNDLSREIQDTKEKFPQYSSVLNWKDVVYCVWGAEPYEGSNEEVLYEIFHKKEDAEAYVKNPKNQGMRIFETEVK